MSGLTGICVGVLVVFCLAAMAWMCAMWRQSDQADGQPGDPARWDAVDDDMVRHHLRAPEVDQ